MRKLFIAIGIFFAFSFCSKAQNARRAVSVNLDPNSKGIYDSLFYANDWRIAWYKEMQEGYARNNMKFDLGADWMNKMLKVGDPMPDLELGTIMNNPSGKKRFSDFKGKIVILDFWSTSCGQCIRAFPKMAALQEKFEDKIQIILVNPIETEEAIRKKMGKNIVKIPNLPSIVAARHLIPYFPTYAVPYHVWIDQNGIIRILGSMFNTYEEKIQNLLDKKPMVSLNTEATRPEFNPLVPYYKLVGNKIDPKSYNSFFTCFNNDYAPIGGGVVYNQVDSTINCVRNTFINQTIDDLYEAAFKPILSHRKNGYIFYPFGEPVYHVKDSLRYKHELRGLLSKTDNIYKRSSFCYEQVYPKGISEADAHKMMVEDLNSYFGQLYGTYARAEKQMVPAYVVMKKNKSNNETIRSKTEGIVFKKTELSKNGRKLIRYRGSLLKLIDGVLRPQLVIRKIMLIDETDMASVNRQKLDFELPANASISELNIVLKRYGLVIVEKKIELSRLVISDTKANETF